MADAFLLGILAGLDKFLTVVDLSFGLETVVLGEFFAKMIGVREIDDSFWLFNHLDKAGFVVGIVIGPANSSLIAVEIVRGHQL